jgi:hypothetical protein
MVQTQLHGDAIMGQAGNAAEIALALLFCIGVALGLWKIKRITTQINQSRAIGRDGSRRPLTPTERYALAEYLAHQRHGHFWLIVAAGTILIGLTLLTLWAAGLIPPQ